jgi:hypothetical protein
MLFDNPLHLFAVSYPMLKTIYKRGAKGYNYI